MENIESLKKELNDFVSSVYYAYCCLERLELEEYALNDAMYNEILVFADEDEYFDDECLFNVNLKIAFQSRAFYRRIRTIKSSYTYSFNKITPFVNTLAGIWHFSWSDSVDAFAYDLPIYLTWSYNDDNTIRKRFAEFEDFCGAYFVEDLLEELKHILETFLKNSDTYKVCFEDEKNFERVTKCAKVALNYYKY